MKGSFLFIPFSFFTLFKFLLFLFFFLCLGFFYSAEAIGRRKIRGIEGKGRRYRGVEVRLSSPRLVEIKTGRIVTGSFVVFNKLEQEEKFFEELDLPPQWQIIVLQKFPFILKAREQQVRLITFFVPIAYPSGKYQITYRVRSQRDYDFVDRETILVDILPVLNLEILVEEKPQIVIAGETYRVRFLLVNRGNSRLRAKLKVKGTPDYPITSEQGDVILEAGGSRVVNLEVKTDGKIKQKIKHMLELEVKAKPEKVKNDVDVISDKKTLSINVIPRIRDKFDSYHKISSQIEFIGLGEEGKTDFQVEFSGSGALDEEEKRTVDFFYLGPDRKSMGSFAQRNEFWINYYDELFALHAGDRSFPLSPLTENYNYGRGIEININPEKFGYGVFYMEKRWGNPTERKTGTYLQYRLTDYLSLKGNFLNTSEKAKLYSLQAEIKPDESMDVSLEYALSNGQREDTSTDYAYRIELDGRVFEQIRYSLEKIYAGPHYFGCRSDSDYTDSTISFPLYQNLRGNFFYRTYKNNLDLELTKNSAIMEKTYSTGITYSFPFGTSVSFDYEGFYKEDHLLPVECDYEDKTLKLTIGQYFRLFQFQTYIERGERKDNLLDITNNNLERYSFYSYFRPSARQTYSFYTRIGQNNFANNSERTKSTGISSNWHMKKNIYFHLNYAKNNFGSNLIREQTNISSTFTYTLPNNHSIALKNHWLRYEEKKEQEYSFFLSYTIPLQIPVKRIMDLGTLKGKVYDGEKSERIPIPNVILTMNVAQGGSPANEVTAVTNPNGEFIFPSLKQGTYYLQVLENSIGLDRLTHEKLPLKVEVKAGETTEIELGIMTSCRVSGKVAIFNLNQNAHSTDSHNKYKRGYQSLFLTGSGESDVCINNDGKSNDFYECDLKEPKGLANILVELKNAKEVFKQVTGEKGGFSFPHIRPGKWTLKIYENNFPAHHYLEKKELHIELKPGEENRITVKVLPTHRPIQMIDQGVIN